MTSTHLVVRPNDGQIDRVFKNGEYRKNVGTSDRRGYVYLSVNNKSRPVHQIIWEFVNGDIPAGLEIDHIDGQPCNNRITNLRLVTRRQNMQNRHWCSGKNKTSFVKGVHWDKGRCKWRTHIVTNGKQIFIGRYETIEEAQDAYAKAASELHTHNPHARG